MAGYSLTFLHARWIIYDQFSCIYQRPDINVCRLIGRLALERLRMRVRDDRDM